MAGGEPAEASTVTPSILRSSASILAPILVGFRLSPGEPLVIMPSVGAAASSVPTMKLWRNQRVGNKTVKAIHTRGVVAANDNSQPTFYRTRARCLDITADETPDASKPLIWEVRFWVFPKGANPGLMPEDYNQTRLDVTTYRLRNQGVVGAQQLALFRHLFVANLRAMDPGALVFGGQHDWRPEWWPNPTIPDTQ